MRVVHITSGDLWGGAEAQLYSLVKAHRGMDGIEADVLLFNDGLTAQRLRACGVTVTVISETEHGPISLLCGIVAFLRRTQPQIVHTHGYKECVLGSLAAFLAGGVRQVRTVHGWVETRRRFWQWQKMLVRVAEISAMRSQQAVVAVSAELGVRLSRYVKRANVVVIENGIDIAAVQHAAQPPAGTTRTQAGYRIGIVARLVSVKRVDLFLHVCRLLQEQHGPRMRAVIVGDGPLMQEVQRQVRELTLDGQIELLGFVPDVSRHLANIDVLLMTSEHEGLPMALLEAMALKVPVVAHAVGGIPAALDDGNCGWLVHRQEPHSYCQAVQDVLRNTTETKRKTTGAYERVVSRYTAQSAAQHYRELYRTVVAGSDSETKKGDAEEMSAVKTNAISMVASSRRGGDGQ